MTTTVDDVAALLTDITSYADAITAATGAGLSVTGDGTDGGGLIIDDTIGAQRVGGAISIVHPFWLIYDTTDPDKTKVKVPSGGGA